jgi:hypothetical protein
MQPAMIPFQLSSIPWQLASFNFHMGAFLTDLFIIGSRHMWNGFTKDCR